MKRINQYKLLEQILHTPIQKDSQKQYTLYSYTISTNSQSINAKSKPLFSTNKASNKKYQD